MQKLQLYHDKLLLTMRLKADHLADLTVQELYSANDKSLFKIIFSDIQVNDKALPDKLPDFVVDYFTITSSFPGWADRRKMAEGSEFFSKYSQQILLILGLYSLPYCYAAAHGAEVLQITKRITDDPGKRFLETSEFLLDVMAPNAFEGRGKGIRSAQKVRLIHAIARHYVNKSDKWNGEWGVPVNQEDMAGTNMAFSLIALRGLRKMGINVSSSEASAYMHLWNVIGYILGVEEILLPDTSKEAYLLDRLISKRMFKSSDAGTELTTSLISYIKSSSPAALPEGFVEAYMRYFLGDEVADLLNIPTGNNPSSLFTSLESLNRINNMFGFNKGNYYQTQHLVKIQKKMLREGA